MMSFYFKVISVSWPKGFKMRAFENLAVPIAHCMRTAGLRFSLDYFGGVVSEVFGEESTFSGAFLRLAASVRLSILANINKIKLKN